MKKAFAILTALVVVTLTVATGCSMTSTATEFNGLTTPDGAVTHVSTTNVAVHFLFSEPVIGDATLHQTVSDHTEAAKAEGAKSVRIVQSSVSTLWYIFPPITFIIHPVISNVASDAIR